MVERSTANETHNARVIENVRERANIHGRLYKVYGKGGQCDSAFTCSEHM